MSDSDFLFRFFGSPESQEKERKMVQEAVGKMVKELAESIRTGSYKKQSKPMTTEEFEKEMEDAVNELRSLRRSFEKICTQPSFPTPRQ
jgi:uncharacterized protein (UPF0305 family)